MAALSLQVMSPVEGNALVRYATTRALQLDGSRADAEIYRAASGLFDVGRSVSAVLRKVLQEDPGNAMARYWAASFCSSNGDHDEALAHLRQAVRSQPQAPLFRVCTAAALFYAGRLDVAEESILEAVEMAPDNFGARLWRSMIFGIAGEHEDALIAGEEAVKIISSSWALAMFGWVQARAGFRDQAEAILQHLRQRASTEYVARSGIAGILSGLGRFSEAWDELVRAKREQEPILGWSRVDPRWEPLRRVLPRL